MPPLTKKTTLADFRAARADGRKLPMLTCYDYTTARLMEKAGVPSLLVGDSAANVILGHPTTLPVSLRFMIDIAGAVRRGAPNAWVVADMPFGSYAGSLGSAVKNVCRMAKESGCDAVKVEVAGTHTRLVREATDAGVAVVAHLGLRPQSVSVMGGYRVQGRTSWTASQIIHLASDMARAGAVALLLEAVPVEVAEAVVEAVDIPVIGCGAGRVCHGFVFVTHDSVGLTDHMPKFAPKLGDLATPAIESYERYVEMVADGRYPVAEHNYEMPPHEREKFLKRDEVPF